MNPDDPQALESTLAAYRRLPRAEPAAALDAAVKAHARAAMGGRRRRRWPVLFATAATALLATSLGWRTWQSGQEQPAPLVPVTTPAEATAKSEPASVVLDASDRREADGAGTAAAPLRQALNESPAAAPTAETGPTPAAVAERRAVEPSRDAERPAQDVPQAFTGTPPTPPAPITMPPASSAPTAPAGAAQSVEAAPIVSLAKSAEQPAADSAAGAFAGNAEAGHAGREDAAPAPASLGGLRAKPAAATRAGHDRLRRQDGTHATADEGLRAIRELQRQGRLAEAREALEAWQLDWPDAVVPEDLRNLQR